MAPSSEHDRDPPGKLISLKSVANILGHLEPGLDLAGAILLVFFGQVEMAQILGLSSAVLRSVLRSNVIAAKR